MKKSSSCQWLPGSAISITTPAIFPFTFLRVFGLDQVLDLRFDLVLDLVLDLALQVAMSA